MMKSVLIVIVSLCINACITPNYSSSYNPQTYYSNVSKIYLLQESFETESKRHPVDLKKIEELFADMSVSAIEIQGCCKLFYCQGRYSGCADCLDSQRIGMSRSAAIGLFLAQTYALNGEKEKAKAMYRYIIISGSSRKSVGHFISP